MDEKQIKVVFSIDTSDIVSAILRKYNLEENTDKTLEKAEAGELLNAAVLVKLVENITAGNIPEKDITNELQKQFHTSNQIAQNIAIEVKSRLLPLARKATQEEAEMPTTEMIESPVEIEKEYGEKKELMHEVIRPATKPYLPQKQTDALKNVPKQEENKQQDSYREPIE